jgi:hypothetical protein
VTERLKSSGKFREKEFGMLARSFGADRVVGMGEYSSGETIER